MRPKVVVAVALALSLLTLPAGPQSAAAQEDIPATLTTLLKGHVYRGLNYRKETIRKVQFAEAQAILGIEFDDAEESEPITALIPLREVTDVTMEGATAVISCRQPACITLTSEGFQPATAKLAQNPGAKLVGQKSRNAVEFGYRPENARAIVRALGSLTKAAKGR